MGRRRKHLLFGALGGIQASVSGDNEPAEVGRRGEQTDALAGEFQSGKRHYGQTADITHQNPQNHTPPRGAHRPTRLVTWAQARFLQTAGPRLFEGINTLSFIDS